MNRSIVTPSLTTRSLFPDNRETPIQHLRTWAVEEGLFYKRNHFSYPFLPEQAFILPIRGEVVREIRFRYQDLLRMPSKSLSVVLECSGNRRAYYEPKVYGEQWEEGAISQGEWRGVPLRDLLQLAGVKKHAVEVLFESYDSGIRPGTDGIVDFSRSLPLDKATHPDTLIAYAYNGRPIPYKHGFPLRVIVPQWYAMASVKWLRGIKVIAQPFQGPFQTMDYMYYPDNYTDTGKTPVTVMNVNSIIQFPLDLSTLAADTYEMTGIAWTGLGEIAEVEVTADQGVTWDKARVHKDPGQPYGWTLWSHRVPLQKGEYVMMSRAKDSYGRIQPLTADWNRKGYGYNAVARIRVKAE